MERASLRLKGPLSRGQQDESSLSAALSTHTNAPLFHSGQKQPQTLHSSPLSPSVTYSLFHSLSLSHTRRHTHTLVSIPSPSPHMHTHTHSNSIHSFYIHFVPLSFVSFSVSLRPLPSNPSSTVASSSPPQTKTVFLLTHRPGKYPTDRKENS